MAKLNHNCENASQMIGYNKALNDMFNLIKKQTGMSGDIRMIDALPLVEAIRDTNEELLPLLKQHLKELSETELNLISQQYLS